MAHAWHHAESSARRYGGSPEAYMSIHEWLDATKIAFAGRTHRALRHHAFGIFEAERVFGRTIDNGAGRAVPVRLIAEQHIREDLGRVPSVQDWLAGIALQSWMMGGGIEQGDSGDDDTSLERWRADVAAGRTILGWIEWRMDRGASLTRPVLDLSTGHLSESTRALLDDTPVEKLPGTVLAGEYGWLVHAGFVDTWPDDLRAAIALAHAQGCDRVLFDRDGLRHPDLPWFGDDDVATGNRLRVASA